MSERDLEKRIEALEARILKLEKQSVGWSFQIMVLAMFAGTLVMLMRSWPYVDSDDANLSGLFWGIGGVAFLFWASRWMPRPGNVSEEEASRKNGP